MPGPITGGVIPSSTWANIPAASTVSAGTQWRVTDINNSIWVSDTVRWSPLGGTVNHYTMPSVTSGLCTTETILGQTLLLINELQTLDTVRIFRSVGKSGTTNTFRESMYVGTAGTTLDDRVYGSAQVMAATNKAQGGIFDFILTDATHLQRKGSLALVGTYGAVSGASVVSPVSIPNASSNALYLTWTGLSDGSTDTLSLEDFKVQIVSTA